MAVGDQITDFLKNVPGDVRGGAIGVVGTLIGACVGVCLGRYLQLLGRVYVDASEWKLRYQHQGSAGQPLLTDDPTDAQGAVCSLCVQLFNDRDRPTALREVLVEFRAGRRTLLAVVPDDRGTQRIIVASPHCDPLKEINLPPRQYVRHELVGIIRKDDLGSLPDCDAVYLSARYPSGRRFVHRATSWAPPTRTRD